MMVSRLADLECDIKNLRRQTNVCPTGKHEIMKSSSQFSKLILFYEVTICKKYDMFDLVPTSAWRELTKSPPWFVNHINCHLLVDVFLVGTLQEQVLVISNLLLISSLEKNK